MGKRKSDFIESRNEHLRRAFRLCLAVYGGGVMELFETVATMPAPRFYMSEERALYLINEKRRQSAVWNRKMTPSRREMVNEIERRVEELQRSQPGLSLRDAVFEVVNSPAPAFYLTPNTIRTILYRRV